MNSTEQKVIVFGVFELDRISGELRKQGMRVRLSEQPLQILLLLIERAGETVTRDELQRRLWPADTFVDFDAGLNSAIKKLRDTLGDPTENPRFIETVPRRGYRFVGPVERPPIHGTEGVPTDRARAGHRHLARWLLTAAAAVLLIGVAVWLSLGDGWDKLSARMGLAAAPKRITPVAVLPFDKQSGIQEHDYFVDGMTEALTTNLAQFKSLKVASRTSAMQYKQRTKPLAQIAAELKVDAVVEGAVVGWGDQMRITVQLIDAATDRHIWANAYTREVRNVLGLQIELAETIANQIRVEVRPEERSRLTRYQEVRPEAYDEYLKGRFYLSSRGAESLLRAAEHFQSAIAHDSSYAPAYSGLSDTYRMFGTFALQGFVAPRDSMPKAETAARQAQALDPTLAEAHASLAGVLYRYHWKWTEAEEEFRIALKLDPGYAEGHRARAVFLMFLRRNDEAVSAAQRARDLDPLSPAINVELAEALTRAGRYDEATQQLRKAQDIAPNFTRVHRTLALTYLRMGDPVRALATFDQFAAPLSAREPGFAYLCAIQGRRQEARNFLSELERRAHSGYVSPQHFALVHLGLGEQEQALQLLEKAYEERAFEVLSFSGLIADVLVDNPRFQRLLHRMGLGGEPGYAPRAATRASH